jgi:hypothetical protein
MIPLIPLFTSVVIFGTAAWTLNKVLAKVTGRDLEGNLDNASAKVLAFVMPAKPPEIPPADPYAQTP